METIARLLLIITLITWSSSQPVEESLQQIKASVMDALDEMGQKDDWMDTIKLIMKEPKDRKFKVQNSMTFEFDSMNPEEEGGPITTLTTSEDMIPSVNAFMEEGSERGLSTLSRNNENREAIVMFHDPPKLLKTEIVMGNVGVCKTQYRVETLSSAVLLREPDAQEYVLAHPVRVMVGKCRSKYPVSSTSGMSGGCVLSAQAHMVWLVVQVTKSNEFKNCIPVPGVSSIMKCPDWVIVGGRCVYEPRMEEIGPF